MPTMVGECVYGVRPVLAALSANKREFYILYLKKCINLSVNNRRKKIRYGLIKY